MSYRKRPFRQEQKTLNIDEEFEVMDWTERYGVSAEKLKEAVKTVGNRVSDVVRYLLDGGNSAQLSNR